MRSKKIRFPVSRMTDELLTLVATLYDIRLPENELQLTKNRPELRKYLLRTEIERAEGVMVDVPLHLFEKSRNSSRFNSALGQVVNITADMRTTHL